MLRPDKVSKQYADIIPRLHALGYTCTLNGSVSDQVCVMRIGRADTVDIFNDGTWRRRDGMQGAAPQDLLDLVKAERGREVEHHLRRQDMRALAQDTLNAQGVTATSVRAVRILGDGSMEADVFLHTGRPQTVSIAKDWNATCRQWRADLIH